MKQLLLVLALLSATAAALAVEDQAFWGVFAETRVQKMAGMPALPPMPPGLDAAAMSQIPGMAAMLGMGAPQRALSVRLWSPGLAPEGAIATIAPPAGLKKVPALAQAITFRWKPVPGVLGYHARIMGMQGKKTLILWSSSEIQADPGAGWDYLRMAEVAEMVKSTAMMEPACQEVVVPAGIFKECDMLMFTMVGYGPGAALAEGQPLPRVQTKTTLNIMLGGKAMAEMGE